MRRRWEEEEVGERGSERKEERGCVGEYELEGRVK